MDFYSEMIDGILSQNIQSKQELHKLKRKLCKKYKISHVPPNSAIIANIPKEIEIEEKELLISILQKKPMRTISGVAIVAVMTSPEECPHGTCIPCPGGPELNTPQSYTGHEPATMRAIINDFDPFYQTKSRIDQLKAIGHPVDKIDLILMGGTFTSRFPSYQEWFVKRCFDALNGKNSDTLSDSHKKNETAKSRCIGLTVETRPDWFRLQHADNVLNLGATRVELGIQTVYDDILFEMKRGHTVLDSIDATRIAKNCGIKICYHMMPGLPGSDGKRDIETFNIIFEDTNFKPDMIKIYPTLTVNGTCLYELWKNGKYKPLCSKEATRIIAEVKKNIPEWVRIQRIQRDIPAPLIEKGVDKSNLRQIVELEMKLHGDLCRCIRCREIGHKSLNENIEECIDDIELECTYYTASGGEEIFISLVNRKYDALVGYLRLRDIIQSHRIELNQNPCMIIRELKVLGKELSIGKKTRDGWQHKGLGQELLKEAERICIEEFDKLRLFVLSGIGVKEYYRNSGYKNNGLYLEKILDK